MPRRTYPPRRATRRSTVPGAHRIAPEALVINAHADLTGRRGRSNRRRTRYDTARRILSAHVDAAIAAMSTPSTPGVEVLSP